MGIFDRLFNFFINKEYSIKSKVLWGILFVLLIIGVNDFVGFTFYYSTTQEIELISKIESTKQISQHNEKLMTFLEAKESEILNRKYLYEKFLDIFKNTDLPSDTKKEVITT